MKAHTIAAASSLSAAVVVAVLTGGSIYLARSTANDEFDTITSGSIGRTSQDAAIPAPPARFSVSNLGARTACLTERGGTLTSRSRSFWASPDCDDVWPGLSLASNWTQNEDGTVTLTDDAGGIVLTLVHATGFSYAAADLPGADIAWLMLP